jgi:hypothetical protein
VGEFLCELQKLFRLAPAVSPGATGTGFQYWSPGVKPSIVAQFRPNAMSDASGGDRHAPQ